MPKKNPKSKLKARNKKKQKKLKQQQKKEQQQNNNNNNNNNNKPNEPNLDIKGSLDDPNIKEFRRDIHIHSLTVTPPGGGKPLIRSSDLKLIHGHRYGLIGYNGAGKTTLLKKLDSGTIKAIPKYLRVHLVRQELEGTELTVMETVLAADEERSRLLKQQKQVLNYLESFGIEHPNSPKINSNGTVNTKDNKNNNNKNSDTKTPEINESKTEQKSENNQNSDKKLENSEKTEIPENSEKNKESSESDKTTKKESSKEDEEEMSKFLEYQEKLNEIRERLKFISAETAETRASRVLSGLQFTDRMKNMKTSDLSGGWRMRVRLAMALFIQPDLLMLDEPTNHLDFPSVLWLTEYLCMDYPEDKTIILVSHDRRFLNDVCTDIMHLSRERLYFYSGNYDAFLEIRSQSRQHQRKQYERQQKMIKHNEEFIARFKANKKWSTQAQSRQKLLSKTKRIAKVLNDLEFRFSFPEPQPLKNPNVISLDKVTFGYFGVDKTAKSYLLKNVELRVQYGTKIGVLGANGAGKSTLIRLIMNELKPINGTAFLSNSVQTGYFAQHHIETLDYNKTSLEFLKNLFGSGTTEQQCYQQLGRFQMGGKIARQKISTLSGGQKSRVAFSILTWYSPHLVIMDEPTNNLDMPTVDALAMALCDFPGTVIVVSHDQHFVETVCDEYWAVGNRTVKVFENFEKCRNYCSNKCKPFDVLPREYSSINVRDRYKTKVSRTNKLGVLDQEYHRIEEEKENKIINKKNRKKYLKQSEIHVDPERVIDNMVMKELEPNQVIKHLLGWSPDDNNSNITQKLGFIIFHDYYDKKFLNIETLTFFERWKKLFNYCIPINHLNNQIYIVDIIYACWKVAFNDKNKKAIDNYSLGKIFEILFQLEMINIEAVKTWYNDKINTKNKDKRLLNNAIKQFTVFFDYIENDIDSDSDSDSSSD